MVTIAVEPITGAVSVRTRVLGAGTAVRFALLLLFIAADSLELLSVAVPVGEGGWNWGVLCTLAIGVDPTQPYLSGKEITNSAFIQACQAAHEVRSPAGLMATGTVAVFVVATLIYLLSPSWRRRRGRLLRVDLSSADELALHLKELVARTGLRRAPEFVIDPMARTVGAVVFGRLGRYTVCLDAGLIARSGTEPGVLRDVVLHELAHIRNHDVDITYATVALWRAFLLCAVLPYLGGAIYPMIGDVSFATALTIWRDQWQLQLRGVVHAVVLVALTYLVRADILRTRELYADVDAAHRAGQAALSWRYRRPRVEPGFAGWHRFRGLWRTHPGWLERNRSLADPAVLFGVTALPMFLTGVTAQVADSAMTLVIQKFGLASNNEGVAGIPTWLTAALVVGIAGYSLWRAVGYAILTARPVPTGWRAGFSLGAGMAVGELVTFRTAGVGLLPPDPAILLVFLVGGPLFTWWVVQCAELWVRGCRGRSIRPVQFFGLAAAFIVFGTWYGYWMTESYLLLIGLPVSPQLSALAPATPVWFPVIAGQANQPMVLVGAATLWLFPLLSLLRRPVTGIPEWVRRARPDISDARSLARGMPSLQRAAMAAVLGGALCCLAVVVVMFCLHLSRPPHEARNESWALIYGVWLMACLGAATVVTATTVSAITGRQRLTIALAASGGAALIGLTCLFLFAAVDGCVKPMQVMASTCGWRPRAAWSVVTPQVPFVLGLSMYLAAVGALAGAVVADVGRRIAGRLGRVTPRTEVAGLPGSPIVRRIVVLTACGLVAALGVNTAIGYWRSSGADVAATAVVGHEPPRTAGTVKLELGAWLQVGGSDKVTKLKEDFERAGQAAIDAARAATQNGQHTVQIDRTVLVPICAAMEQDADDAMTFVPIPDGPAQAAWAKMLSDAAASGADCQRALRQGDDALFSKSLSEGTTASTAYAALQQRFGSIENSP